MNLLSGLRSLASSLFHRSRIEDEMEEELRSHIQERANDLEHSGMPRAEAERQARLEFGGYQKVKEECRESLGIRFWETLVQDVRYGLRVLRKSPGFTAVAILTLAMGIGANTAIFSVVQAVVLRPLPFIEPDRLVQLQVVSRETGEKRSWVPYRDVVDWKQQSRSFQSTAAYRFALLNLTGDGVPQALYGAGVSYNLLSTLGVRPMLGRYFDRAEEQPGNDHEVILSYKLWQNLFDSDPAIVGAKIHLHGPDGEDRLVVGVMPEGFNFPLNIPSAINPPSRQMAFWVPLGLDPLKLSRDDHNTMVVARLRPGVSMAQAQSEMEGVAARLERENPQTNSGRGISVVSLAGQILGPARSTMWMLLAASGLVILIACANIANLFLSKSVDRGKEKAIRSALGARRSRLLRQWITESVLISLMGGCLGLALAAFSLPLLLRLAPQDIPRLADTAINAIALAVTFGLALLAGLFFGLLPVLHSGTNDYATLKEGEARVTPGRKVNRVRDILILTEIALSVVIVLGAGLVVRSFKHLVEADRGYQTDHLLMAIIVLRNSQYAGAEAQVNFFKNVLAGVEAIPGVAAAGVVNGVPLSGNIAGAWIQVEGHPNPARGEDRPVAEVFSVSADYLQTAGIPLVAGRNLTTQDSKDALPVAVINELAAKRFFPQQDPLGKRLLFDDAAGHVVWRQIVGVVKNTLDLALDRPAEPTAYVPMEQSTNPPGFLVARTTVAPTTLAPQIREAVAAVDKDQPVFLVTSMQQVVDDSVAERRFSMVMLAAFGTLALVLAAVGIYGVVAYSVARRTREIGLRMALGADAGNVCTLVIGRAVTLSLAGVAIGAVAFAAVTRFIASLLFEVRATDPLTFVSVGTLVLAVAFGAAYIPARRAIRVDPMVALRYE